MSGDEGRVAVWLTFRWQYSFAVADDRRAYHTPDPERLRRLVIYAIPHGHTPGALPCKGGFAQNVKTDAAMPYITKTPKPPYYAVVFTSINADVDHSEHTQMYKRMVEIAESYEGYIGIEPARNPDGSGVAVIYWKDLATIQAFARHPEHVVAKKKGREIWYTHYLIRICKVERDYGRPEESKSG
jgi:heme-degrading monooxygenase HmoA